MALPIERKWLTVPEAARHLSKIYGDDFSKHRLLQQALDGHLKLSVMFMNDVMARRVKCLPIEEVKLQNFPLASVFRAGGTASTVETERMTFGLNMASVYLSDEIETLYAEEVMDLPMVGNERIRVRREAYEQLATHDGVIFDAIIGSTLVERPDGQRRYELQEFLEPTPFETPQCKGITEGKCIRAQGLPDESVLVVRMSVLNALQKRFEKEHSMKEAEKITGPRPKWFTVDQLAEELRFSVWKIRHFIETGQLIASERFSSKLDGADVFISLPPGGWSETNKDEMSSHELNDDLCEVFTNGEKQYYIMLEEVERFEEEHGLSVFGFQESKTRLEEAGGQESHIKEPEPYSSELLIAGGGQEVSADPTPYTQEAYPGEPGEKAVYNWDGIGAFFNKAGETIRKHWSKEPGFPLNTLAGGEKYAYPTCLTSWLRKREKPSRTYNTPAPPPPKNQIPKK